MTKILGLDLGTNSIGWAIRDTDVAQNQFIATDEEQNEFFNAGVVIFRKGVGEGKSGEFSLAAERRSNRSKRRLYNAKRYRKWEVLKVLFENNMCPLTNEERRLWSVGNWQDVDGNRKNLGRRYPMSPDFLAWLAMDFEKIGNEWNNEKLKPEFVNPYELRSYLIENNISDDKNGLFKVGRAFYHLVQRRGFRTSRKSGKSAYGDNTYLEEKIKENPEWKASKILQYGLETENRRIRNCGVIQRRYFEEEFKAICVKQNITAETEKKIYNAIYFVRPLRTQKGLVGKCTLEKGKNRIPLSHPAYEEFRALQYINNIKWRESNSKKPFEPIPFKLKKAILKDIFFRRKEKGIQKGMIDVRSHFEFKEIVEKFSDKHKYEFNYAKYLNEGFELRANPNVTACPVIAGLMNVFASEWTNNFLEHEYKLGIDWTGLQLNYTLKYGKIKQKGKSIQLKKAGDIRRLDRDGIWHILFDYLQIQDKEEKLDAFCRNVLSWNDDKIEEFKGIGISQGYGSLSYSAIRKITPFLEEGYIYSEAVSFANLKQVFGEENYNKVKGNAQSSITEVIQKVADQKEILTITNGLIQKYFGESYVRRAKGFNGTIEEINAYKNDVKRHLGRYFGEETWLSMDEAKKKYFEQVIFEKYIKFLDGKQDTNEKASFNQKRIPEIDYYRLPRLDEAIKELLANRYGVKEDKLNKLYHPSDIEIYPKSRTGKLEDPNPPSKGWKNPMAMRTMYELRKLVNYLIDEGRIEEDTKIVVEMARELNDANKRWAIQTYQKNREDENIEFAKAILGVAKEKYPNLNENDADNIDKVRLWWEQLENGDEIYKQVKALKEDIQKYRLWSEQGCKCMYTGKVIGIADLFDGTRTQFEHTLYLSKSFDNSQANLTVCDAEYNMKVKKNQIPTQLPNYYKESDGYPAIEPQLKKWKEKAASLKERVERNKIETKKAIRSSDIERKNQLIRIRHLLQFDLDYWEKKLQTFTVTEIPNWWKNSQLIDTQIITKYARAYLKTVFNKVDVQKGSITAEFRKIYGIMGEEKKDRSKHSHHAVDAAVLALIPGSAKREAILEEYYLALEINSKYNTKPYYEFKTSHILDIEKNVLINHVIKDQTLSNTFKKVRLRGEVQYLKDKKTKKFILDEHGKKIPLMMQGDSIRGQLHQESYFGAIKVNQRNENGYPVKKDGKYLTKMSNDIDELWVVKRKDIKAVDFEKDIIVDELLKIHLLKQLSEGVKQTDLVDFNNKLIRHIRCRVKAGRGYLKIDTAIPIKPHTFESKHRHKQDYLVQNDENYLYLLYEERLEDTKTGKFKTIRGYRILNLFDVSKLRLKEIDALRNEKDFNSLTKKVGCHLIELPLKTILKVGDRAIPYKIHSDEVTHEYAKNHLFRIIKFNEPTPSTAYIYLQNHMEARPNDELTKLEEKDFHPETYQPRISLSADKFNCLIEHDDFEIKPDGGIDFKYQKYE